MINLLRIIDQKRKELDKYKPLPEKVVKELEEWLRVELTYSSNAIEGNTLSRIETAEVIEKGVSAVISGKALKDQLEAVNHAKAIDFIKDLVQKRKGHQFITESDIKDIHKIILTGIDDNWAGKYRQTDVFIRGTDVEFPPPNKIPYLMKEFIQWLSIQQKKYPVRVASEAHFKLVSIHPFIDGNGRTARLLMNLILAINSYPMAVIRNEERTEYLEAVNQGQKQNNLNSFYQIIERGVDRSLDAYLNIAKGKFPLAALGLKGELLKIGQLAKITGETVPTIRFWTNEGLLTVQSYSPGKYQLFSKEMIATAKRIRQLQNKERRTLIEIKNILKKPATLVPATAKAK